MTKLGRKFTPNETKDLGNGIMALKLTLGKWVKINASDYKIVSAWRWFTKSAGTRFYAVAMTSKYNGARRCIKMHKLILPCEKTLDIDHKDRDGLNNTRINLRVATRSQNMQNQGLRYTSTTGVKGVTWSNGFNRWRVNIGVYGKCIHLGLFACFKKAVDKRMAAEEIYYKKLC